MDLFSFFSRKPSSKDVAKSRLKFVLVQDRINCSTQVLEMLKTDILKVISNYMEIDEEELDIQISETTESSGEAGLPVLYANIPIKNMRKVSSR
jgi:cell division topological specificity factor